MAVPNINSTRTGVVVRRKPRRQMSPELAALLSFALLACIMFTFHSTKQLAAHHDKLELEQQVARPHAPAITVKTEALEHEDAFLGTIKSCLPQTNNKKCKTYVADGTTRQRVVVISPPGELTELFFNLIESVVAHDQATDDIEMIHTTHMAPYGYGKTHGYTRIIRVVPHPLVLGVTTTLQSTLKSGQTYLDIHMDDLKANLRQQMRYHCRLSHISAHTALWTLTLDDLSKLTLSDLVSEIRAFLGIVVKGEEEGGETSAFGMDIIPPDGMGSTFHSMSTYGASMLTSVQTKTATTSDILKELDDVLLDEMKISKNLSAWPCESFWTVGDPNVDKLKLSPAIAQISQAMSPDCDDPLIQCWVKRDKCEAKGDGACKDEK